MLIALFSIFVSFRSYFLHIDIFVKVTEKFAFTDLANYNNNKEKKLRPQKPMRFK